VTFVIDASVALAWSLDDEQSDSAEAIVARLLSEGAVAPAHWPLEVANGIRSAERRGRMEPSAVPQVEALLRAMPVEIVPVELSTALGLRDTARQHDLSIYDAAYLGLAEFRGLGLATIDERLAAVCRTVGVPLIQ
jgi:predicted nucleic acid-binding protein